ncbi:MAG: SDR family oxidoreductase [Acidobacteria bacterium]|nr:SDR family oxidoreductase [Acidobacteriota bacterium]
MESLRDREILVVGGTSGIGRAVVGELLAAGAKVMVWSRRPAPDLDAPDVRWQAADVTRPLDEAGLDLPDQLHGLVYCPGSITLTPANRLTEEQIQADFNLNVLGAFRVIRFCLPRLQKAEGAGIVLISTVAVRTGLAFHVSVSTAKAALEGMGLALAAELAPRRIRVNVVAPSITDTPLAAGILRNEEKKKELGQRHPLRRIGAPADIAAAITFLLSDASGWITGQVLPVDGGYSTIK